MAYEDYWKRRADGRMADAQSGADRTILEVGRAYDAAVAELNRDIDRLLLQFAGRDGLTPEEAVKLLQERLSASDVQKIRSRIASIEDAEIKQKLQAKLDSTIYRSRITRLEALKEDIYIQASRMADVELKKSTARYFDIIEEEYLHNIFDCQQQLGFAYSFSKIPEKVIQEILKEDWSGRHYSKRIWDNAMVTGGRIEDVVEHLLLKGSMTGANSRRLAAELNKVANVGKYACERLIRTETTYFVAMADLEAAKARGTKRIQFVATLDQRTSDQCREADGKIILIEDAAPGKNIPPLHPFCRSVVIDVVEGLSHRVRVARNPTTGRNYQVPADMTYQEWRKDLVDSGKIIEPKAAHPAMQSALKEFGEALDRNDDGSNLFQMLRMSRDNASYVEDPSLRSAYAYAPETDELRYNPAHPYFGQYDMNYVFAHELAHRLDSTWTHSWENGKFLGAIESAKKKLYEDAAQAVQWLEQDYAEDLGFSDIISALSHGRMKGIAGHRAEYWKKDPKAAPMEIFANLVYIKTMKSEASPELQGFLKELIDALEEMV